MNKLKFGIKLFLSYIIFTLILILSIAVVHLYFSKEQQTQQFLKEAKLQSGEKKEKFDAHIKMKKDALLAVSQNEQFLDFTFKAKENYFVDLLFLTLMEANKDYMQMRYIDKNGLELLRFERDKESQKIKKTPNLQDKAQRDYFQEVLKMGQNEVFISNINLNVEHEKVEIPHKSVIRFATPIYRNEKFMGILIINVFMDAFLQNLISSTLYDISLVNEEGYFIKHHKQELAWTKANIKDEAREKKHLLQPLFVGEHKVDMLLVENEATLQKTKSYNNKMIGVILLFAVIMALLFTVIFTKALKNIFDLVALQAQRLDTLLQSQSKLAELGEMVANIAHQWRQPLTRVSLILQNLKAFKAKEKMSDEVFNDSMQNALSQIEFMSNTVDNFRDFYKNDTNKVEFFIEDALQSVLNIIGEPIRHSNIKLSINSSQKTTLLANKNEFSQVLLNLIVNAKDAIKERAVQEGKIDINIREENGTIIIEVCDNALGIEDELKEKIFDPYFSTKRDKGTGIGLYLAKTIIEDKMGGKLSVDNSQEGAVFTIKL
ncbi:HAMP domain-containing histidine kinase [Sulfurimonas crateris]|uniref:histidine kinase n=1 Tax=Sulfurimonas crateris TaxID=2574727 RepID=A0A4U2ZBY3_9BACT|nr:HAMP domain-containing sensor histidine kinase [Sulfurimonas crateris]TKI71202.1 HAMP domain-containing histidine kinase [Sulfurimonas crateris]